MTNSGQQSGHGRGRGRGHGHGEIDPPGAYYLPYGDTFAPSRAIRDLLFPDHSQLNPDHLSTLRPDDLENRVPALWYFSLQ